jgi:ornithine cyclodeaminase
MSHALQAVQNPQAKNFPRDVYPLTEGKNFGLMLAFDHSESLLGYKTLVLSPFARQNGLNAHQGIVVLLDATTGRLKCLLDASTVTGLRTAAVSAVATNALSKQNARSHAIIGTGYQAEEHFKSIRSIRPTIDTVHVYGRTPASTERFEHFLKSQHIKKIMIHSNPVDAVCDADIVTTCTNAQTPFLSIDHVQPGTHINAVGSSRPGSQEVTLINCNHLKIYLDSKEACFLESDEITLPIQNGTLDSKFILGELGEQLRGQIPGREHENDITVFKSVGLGIEDMYAAHFFYQKALELGIGQQIDL